MCSTDKMKGLGVLQVMEKFYKVYLDAQQCTEFLFVKIPIPDISRT